MQRSIFSSSRAYTRFSSPSFTHWPSRLACQEKIHLQPVARHVQRYSSKSRVTTQDVSRSISISHPIREASSKASNRPALNPDRGPVSEESTQTDFGKLDVLSATPLPSTSVDICSFDGFHLDSGLKIMDGDGVMLVGSKAFVWRPWMAGIQPEGKPIHIVQGNELKNSSGVINAKGQFEVAEDAWGLIKAIWPRPDMLIIGTGMSIRPLSPATRTFLQNLGVRLEVLDTRNAAAQFNLLATERGTHEVVAALLPIGFG